MTFRCILCIVLFFKLPCAQYPTQSNVENAKILQESLLGVIPDINSQNSNSENWIQNREKGDLTKVDQNHADLTTFEIKALLTKCSKIRPCDCDSTFECSSSKTENNSIKTKEYRTKCDEEADENILQNCEKKVSLTLKIKNKGITNCKPQYIILDHAFDFATDKKQKLLNPYVLKITEKPVFQMYDLIFENIVNSGPSEKVVSKDDQGYTGCSTNPANPTCGSVSYNNKEVPYSTGFCCPCDKFRGEDGTDSNLGYLENTFSTKEENNIMQVDDQKGISNLGLVNFNNPQINDDVGLKETNMPYLPEDNKNDYRHYGFTDKSGEFKVNEGPSINAQNIIPDNVIGSPPRIGRQLIMKDSKNHKFNPKRVFLSNKQRVHKRGGQNCEDKYTPPNADPDTYHDSTHCMEFSDVWYSIYGISHPVIDHFLEIQIFEKIGMRGRKINWREITFKNHISVGTSSLRYASDDGSILAYYNNNQLESDFTLDSKTHKLLIPEVVGRDMSKSQYPEVQGGPGEYLVVKESDMDLSGKSCNKAEVYTETLNLKKVTIIAKVLNSGLVTSVYYVSIGTCPMEIPASFGSITSQPAMIAPQQQHIFTLEIYCELPVNNFYCSLEVLNMKEQLIAIRRIRFERTDRCICVWYCQCTCLGSDYELKCSPLEIEQFHAAGFQGGLPRSTQVINYSAFDDTISIILHIVLYFSLTLWYMGLMKACLGCCILSIGLWGLDKVLDLPKKLNRYYEGELKDQVVVYDEEGWPVHPKTGKKVNNVAPPTQFAINMVFFLIFPFAIIWNLCRKVLEPKYSADQMFSDLDICKCKASQISLLKDNSLQNSVIKKSSSGRKTVSNSNMKEGSQSDKNKEKSADGKADGNQGGTEVNKKNKK